MNYNASLDQCAEVLAGGIHPKDVVWTKLFAAMCQGEFDGNMVLQDRFHGREEPLTGAELIGAFRTYGDAPPTGTTEGKELPVAEMVAFYRPHYSRDTRNVIDRIRIDIQAARAWWLTEDVCPVRHKLPGRPSPMKSIMAEYAAGKATKYVGSNKQASKDLHAWARRANLEGKIPTAGSIRNALSKRRP